MLAGAARGEMGGKDGRNQVRLLEVDTGRLLGLKYKLICHFKLVADLVGGDIREVVNDMDGSAFLEKDLMGLGVDGYR